MIGNRNWLLSIFWLPSLPNCNRPVRHIHPTGRQVCMSHLPTSVALRYCVALRYSVSECYIWSRTIITYWSLDHLHTLVSHLVDGPCNVYHLLLLDLIQDIINTYEGTCTPNTSTRRCKKNKLVRLTLPNHEANHPIYSISPHLYHPISTSTHTHFIPTYCHRLRHTTPSHWHRS